MTHVEAGSSSSRTSSRASPIVKKRKAALLRKDENELPNKSSKKSWSKDAKEVSSAGMDQEFLKAMRGLKKN